MPDQGPRVHGYKLQWLRPRCIRTRGLCYHAPGFEPGTPGEREVRGIFFIGGARGGEGRLPKCVASQRAAFSLSP